MPISRQVSNIIWGRSGGRCYLDRSEELSRTNSSEKPIGEIAHIVGEKQGSARSTSALGQLDRNSAENLMLLCPNHHTEVDKNPDIWPVERLLSIKEDHEAWVSETLHESRSRQSVDVWSNFREQVVKETSHISFLDRPFLLEESYLQVPLLVPNPSDGAKKDSRNNFDEDFDTLLEWEEQVSGNQRGNRPIPVYRAVNDFGNLQGNSLSATPKILILGPPGSGKSTLLKYVAHHLAKDWLPQAQQFIPLLISLPDWERWSLLNGNIGLLNYVIEQWKDWPGSLKHDDLMSAASEGHIFILFDGMDEIENPGFKQNLEKSLRRLNQCPVIIAGRSVSSDYRYLLSCGFTEFQICGFDKQSIEDFVSKYPAENLGQFNANAVAKAIIGSPRFFPIASNPLLLSIICFVLDEPNGLDLPASRSQLYDRAINKLLQKSRRQEIHYPGQEPSLSQRREILEDAAFQLLAKSEGLSQTLHDPGELISVFEQSAIRMNLGNPGSIASALLADVRLNSGLVRGSDGKGLFFLHFSIHEFLAGCFLARRLDLTSDPVVPQISFDISQLRSLRWEQALMFAVGMLKNPWPLIKWLPPRKSFWKGLSQKRGDHTEEQRIAGLFALCICETSRVARTGDMNRMLMNELTTRFIRYWWMTISKDYVTINRSLARGIEGIARENISVNVKGLGLGLEKLVPEHDEELNIIEFLGKLLKCSDENVVLLAVVTCREFGAAALSPEILNSLPRIMAEENDDAPAYALDTVARLGCRAATAAFLELLAPIVLHSSSACYAVSSLGDCAATPRMLENLRSALVPQSSVWTDFDPVIDAILSMHSKAPLDLYLEALEMRLEEFQEGRDESRTSADLNALIAFRDHDQILLGLANIVQNVQAVWSLSEVVKELTDEDFLEALVEKVIPSLQASDPKVRAGAIDVLRCIGPIACTDAVLESLYELASDQSTEVTSSVAYCFGFFGVNAITSNTQAALLELVKSENYDTRYLALSSISSLAPGILNLEIRKFLKSLTVSLNEEFSHYAHSILSNSEIG